MGGFDRSKLKATSVAVMKQQHSEYQQKRPSGRGEQNRLTVDDGDNKFRFFPFHPDGGGSSYAEAKCVTFLQCEVEERDDNGNVIEGKKTIKPKPIFNSKVHGGLLKDLCEEYLEFAKKIAIPNFTEDAEEQKKIWNLIVGMGGVKPQDTWEVYAIKETSDGVWSDPGILSLKKTVKDKLLELAVQFSDDIQSPDPYSDPDEGIVVEISKSGEKLKTKYEARLDSVKVKENNRIISVYNIVPLTDEQIEAWLKLDSLYKLFVNTFTRKDFMYQIEGLNRFDEMLAEKYNYPIGVFSYDEFLDIVEEIDKMLPDEDQDNDDNSSQNQQEEVSQEALTTISKPIVSTTRRKPVKQQLVQEEEEVVEESQPVLPTRRNTVNKSTQQSTPPPTNGNSTPSRRLTLDDVRKKLGRNK